MHLPIWGVWGVWGLPTPPHYGLSSDTAAALVLARRALRKSERIPAKTASCLQVDRHKHSWSFWNVLGKKLKGIRRHNYYQFRDPK